MGPLQSLLLFAVLAVLGFLFFRPMGFFWRIRSSIKQDDKIIIEDILKQLYHSEDRVQGMSFNGLSGALNIRYKQLVEIVRIMEAKGLIQTSDGLIRLKQSGRDYALKIIRVHRLWEKYLSEKTGFDKSEWHDRAEEMEHLLTAEETNTLATQLGNPRYDPHGDPIPTDTGEIPETYGKPLSSYAVGTIAKINHIEDEPAIIYQQIIAHDLHIGAQLRIIESNEKRLVFHSEGEEYVLAPVVAANITVETLEREETFNENMVRLTNLELGEEARIVGISTECRGASRRRLLDLGFVINSKVHIDMTSPMNDPIAYSVRDTTIALRNDQASYILIEKLTAYE